MTSLASEIQLKSMADTQGNFFSWAEILLIAGLAMLVMASMNAGLDIIILPRAAVWAHLFSALMMIAFGLASVLIQRRGDISDLVQKNFGYQTLPEVAGLTTLIVLICLSTACLGMLVAGSAGEIMRSAIVPASGFALISWIFYSIGRGQELATKFDEVYSNKVLVILAIVFASLALAGMIFVMITGLFVILNREILAVVAILVLLTFACYWFALRQLEHKSKAKRLWKLGCYQTVFVPLVVLGALLLASGQLAPLYALVGVITMGFGYRNLARYVALASTPKA